VDVNGDLSAASHTAAAPVLDVESEFYKEQATRAADAGVVIDLCIATSEYVDLASLKYLATMSGGAIFLYQTVADASLPQDIYRRLRRPRALGGVLRLRTSVEFAPVRAYGHFFPDAEYENLYHVLACDQHDTFAFDFEYTSTQGFSQPYPPILQLAFQYTIAVTDGEGKQFLCRRLRLFTTSVKCTAKAQEVYQHANAETILSLLQHKIVRASLEEGIPEGRLLLQDWLVILTAQYNSHCGIATFGESAATAPLDVTFSKCEALQSLPRFVYALLRSAILQTEADGVHPDKRVHMQCLYGLLEPASLACGVYPVLSSYRSPDEEAFPKHSLSQAALITSGSPIFLLDAFTCIIVYYAPNCPADLPFPPPQNSRLRRKINTMKAERVITPRVQFIRGGHDPVTDFESHLIEEQAQSLSAAFGSPTREHVGQSWFAELSPNSRARAMDDDEDVHTSGVVPGMGFVGFLDLITDDVRQYMQNG
ncbi:hypothetical protein CYMTET_23947, partial [Cymbomonas tetramitiformis]